VFQKVFDGGDPTLSSAVGVVSPLIADGENRHRTVTPAHRAVATRLA
jgi:hypothetical protein